MFPFWHDALYTPLLNFLMFLYSGPAYGNLGVAIMELTVILRVLLLPLSVVDERNRARYERLNDRIEVLERDFKTDHVLRKEKVRELLKEHRVSYWSKALLLAVQAVVLVLLYQVFIGGIRFTSAESLYSWVNAPAVVDTTFLGFDLAAHSMLWAGTVGVLLFVQIYAVQKRREHLVTKSDVMYMFLLPIFTTTVLVLLPMVKALFILTSMLFSIVVFALRRIIWGSGEAKDDED